MAKKKAHQTNIRADIVRAIDEAFPDAVVGMPSPLEETYLWGVYLRLVGSLSQFKGAELLYERGPEGSRERHEGSEPDEDGTDGGEPPSSYWLFFLGLTAEEFTFGCEGPLPDEHGIERDAEGTGWIGCCVGVSLHAPLAAIVLRCLEEYDDGTLFAPELEPQIFDLDFQPADMDEHIREMFDDEGVEAIHGLRDSIRGVLESFGIAVLPDEELAKPVPWLQPGEGISFGREARDDAITVKDAFFHWGP